MKRLKVDLAELGFAFESSSWAMSHFLDTETGAVVMVTEDTRHILDDLNEMYSGESELVDNFEDIVGRKSLKDEVKVDLKLAYEIEQGFGTRYLKIPETDSIEGYADMKAFIETVADERLRESLWHAIQGKGAFGRFKAVLLDHPSERDHWHAFKEKQVRERVLAWLESEDIEAEEVKH